MLTASVSTRWLRYCIWITPARRVSGFPTATVGEKILRPWRSYAAVTSWWARTILASPRLPKNRLPGPWFPALYMWADWVSLEMGHGLDARHLDLYASVSYLPHVP